MIDRIDPDRPLHLLPTAPLAERVLLPGDPGRALRLAQVLLEAPKMFNHQRGLWGYTGQALVDRRPLTIQSTGMGGPSAAIVAAELVALGATTLLRIGTCGALSPEITAGDLVIVTEAMCEDGTSRALSGDGRVTPSHELLSRLVDAGGSEARQVVVVSTDLFYDRAPGTRERWAAMGASVVELETATLLALARRRAVRAGSLLLTTEATTPDGTRQRLDPDRLEDAERALGELAVRALSV